MDLVENLNLNNENNFLENVFGNIINNTIEIGIGALLPDNIENDVIDIKNTLINEGIPQAINETINKVVEFGKEALNINSSCFESVSQISEVFKKGNLLNGISEVIDYFLDKSGEKNIFSDNIINLIKNGKDFIINAIDKNVKNELNIENKDISKLDNYNKKWREAYEKQDFNEMEKIIKKIKKLVNNIAPIEKIINESREIENLHLLIKNNGNNFNISAEENELAKLLI